MEDSFADVDLVIEAIPEIIEAKQQLYAELNKEYPVKSGVALSPLVASWGQYRADDLPLIAIAKHRTQAMKLLDEVKFDL